MAVDLEGGCRVTEMREGVVVEHGTLRVWPQIGRASGAQAISLRVLEFASGLSPGLRNESCDEVLYVLESRNPPPPIVDSLNNTSHQAAKEPGVTIFIDGWPLEVSAQTGIYLRPGQTLTVENARPDSLFLISSRCPEPVASSWNTFEAITSPRSRTPPPAALVRLTDRAAQPTGDRWYRVLVDDEVGSAQVTQFVGSIPPGRAPDHFHTYEEVLFILRGVGRMWAGEASSQIAAGSCIYLPRGQIHCVENTGVDELRLLGVFYPAGSPSVRYEI
jgi:mannose-6-phosphate isomerase-like protein (cupin superfamily)